MNEQVRPVPEIEQLTAAREELERRRVRFNTWICYPALALAGIAMAVALFRLARHHDWTTVLLIITAFALTFIGMFAGPVLRHRNDNQVPT